MPRGVLGNEVTFLACSQKNIAVAHIHADDNHGHMHTRRARIACVNLRPQLRSTIYEHSR